MVRSAREGLAELFALPDGYEVLLGTGGSTTFWDAAAFGVIEQRAEHLVFGEFSSKFADRDARRALPRRPARHRIPAGYASRARRRRVRRRVRVPAQRDVDRRDDGRTPARRAPTALMLVDGTSGAGGLRVDPTQFDVYYFAPQKAFAADAGIWVALCSPAAIERIERVAASGRWVPPVAEPADRARELAPRPDLQHAPARVDLPPRAHRAVDARQRRPRVDDHAVRPVRRDRVRMGGGERARHAVRGQAIGAQPHDRVHRLRRHGRRQPRWRPSCAPTGSSTPSPTGSSAATSCGSRCSRRSTPTTSPPSPAASTTSSTPSNTRHPPTGVNTPRYTGSIDASSWGSV